MPGKARVQVQAWWSDAQIMPTMLVDTECTGVQFEETVMPAAFRAAAELPEPGPDRIGIVIHRPSEGWRTPV